MNSIVKSTRLFEEWLGRRLKIVEADLAKKHREMALAPFRFLRGTFYRWSEVFPSVCEDLMDAPLVFGVGDLHIENYGTWRDSEGRLIWGINDFDEACELPYTNDLVRLAASARLAVDDDNLRISKDEAVKAILKGYVKALKAGGGPIVLAEHHRSLRRMAMSNQRSPNRFWKRMWEQTYTPGEIPQDAVVELQAALPEPDPQAKLLSRQAGVGSLGRPRYVIVSKWRGGLIAREVKTTAPSAWSYVHGQALKVVLGEVVANSVRAHDPFFQVKDKWGVRRLAPDCSKIDIASLAKHLHERMLLEAMGWETANIHLGTDGAREAIIKDLKGRSNDWLNKAAVKMVKRVRSDHARWQKHQKSK